jgi:hypothetical protein
MYNSQLSWYNKEDVLILFDINERTYFRKLKERPQMYEQKILRTKKEKNQP